MPIRRMRLCCKFQPVLLFEPVLDQLHEDIVHILSTQIFVPKTGKDGCFATCEVDNGDIVGAAAKIRNKQQAISLLLVYAIGQPGSSRFIDQSEDLDPSLFSRLFHALSFSLFEVGWYCDNRLAGGPIIVKVFD